MLQSPLLRLRTISVNRTEGQRHARGVLLMQADKRGRCRSMRRVRSASCENRNQTHRLKRIHVRKRTGTVGYQAAQDSTVNRIDSLCKSGCGQRLRGWRQGRNTCEWRASFAWAAVCRIRSRYRSSRGTEAQETLGIAGARPEFAQRPIRDRSVHES